MGYLRRFRPLLAGFALLLSPGVLAPWLQLAHACPTLLPASPVAEAPASPNGHGHHGAHEASPADGQQTPEHNLHSCVCIGACQTVALAQVRAVALPVVATIAASAPGFRPVPAAPFPHHPELHPPATAPPLHT